MLLPALSTDEIRRRVREAEALLRVAAKHARDAQADPAQSEHASARIQSICTEVEALFPGMHEPVTRDPEIHEALAQLKDAELPSDDDEANTDGADTDASEAVDDDDDGKGRDVDYAKLSAAIENESHGAIPGAAAVGVQARGEVLGRVA